MKELPGFHKSGHQRRDLRRPVQTGQKGHQLFPVVLIFRQGIGQRHMAYRIVFVPGGIGGQKGEGILAALVLPVLHQMEKYPLRHPQLLALFRQVQADRPLVGSDLPGKHLTQTGEDPPDPGGRDILRADAEGDRQKELLQSLFRRLRPDLFP